MRSGADISPRSSTSLPTTTPVMTSGYCLASAIAGRDLPAGLLGIVGDPNPLQHLESMPPGAGEDVVEAVGNRIGAYAAGVFGQQRQILFDLPGLGAGPLHQRALPAAERRIGYAIKLLPGRKRGRRQLDRRAEPPPRRADGQRGDGKRGERRADRGEVWRAGHALPLALPSPHAKIERAAAITPLDKAAHLGCCHSGCAWKMP